MKTYLDCIPCFVRQTLSSARLVSEDETVHREALRQVLKMTSEMDMSKPPPKMGQAIHRVIRQALHDPDPYAAIKDRFTKLALSLLPQLRERVQRSEDPLETATRLSIAGNMIDFGPRSDLAEEEVAPALEEALQAPLQGDLESFRSTLAGAEKVTFLADNAGEIVFDRLLLRELAPREITVVVKGSPTINDATLEDAEAAGIREEARVVANGSDAPGTVWEEVTPEVRDLVREADLVISKGQGNYETLSQPPRPIWFLLKAKCPVIAQDIGFETGSLILVPRSPNTT